MCSICQQEQETVIHTLWNCPMANDVFANYQLIHKWPNQINDFKQLWTLIATKLKKFRVGEGGYHF